MAVTGTVFATCSTTCKAFIRANMCRCVKWTKTPASIKRPPLSWPKSAYGNGLNMCFGRHTGYGGYAEYTRGGRHIVIYEDVLGGDNAIETWNRLEDGCISGRVMLNSTYGTADTYPAVPVEYSYAKGAVIAGRPDDDKVTTSTRQMHSTKSRKDSPTSMKIRSTTTIRRVTKTTSTYKTTKITKLTTTLKPTNMTLTSKATKTKKSTMTSTVTRKTKVSTELHPTTSIKS